MGARSAGELDLASPDALVSEIIFLRKIISDTEYATPNTNPLGVTEPESCHRDEAAGRGGDLWLQSTSTSEIATVASRLRNDRVIAPEVSEIHLPWEPAPRAN